VQAQDKPLTVETLRTSGGSLFANIALIKGEKDAVLVDAPFTRADAHRVVAMVLDSGKHLTTIFITHDQDEAFEVADRVVLIDKGSIQQSGTPTEVRNNPANSFVAEFLGLPEKNDPLARNESQLQTC
jgi:ABC-type sugar transport system ATPase subunit